MIKRDCASREIERTVNLKHEIQVKEHYALVELILSKNENKLMLVYKDTKLTLMQNLGQNYGKETSCSILYTYIFLL